MAENSSELIDLLQNCLKLHYSAEIAHKAAVLYKQCSEEYRVYIIGCLILTLTASVKPEYTLLRRRRDTLLASALYSPDQVAELAECGLYLDEHTARPHQSHQQHQQHQPQRRLVCFHCSAKIPYQSGSLAAHRQASPGCYFVRFLDFVSKMGDDLSLKESVTRDIGRYVKALRKLKSDLSGRGLEIAQSYGFQLKLLTFCTARHFMRNSGRVPDRAGDLIQLVHNNEPLFDPRVPETVDVLALLEPLKLLSAGRSESGYHSVVVGQIDQRSGALQSSVHELTNEQLQAIQAVINNQSRGASSGASSAGSFTNG